MPQQPRSRRTAPTATLVLLVGALASATIGCGSSRPTAGPDTTDPTGTTLVDVTERPANSDGVEAAVLAAYQRFWQVWLAANNPPNPEHPELAEVATGVELETIRRSIAEKVANGTYTRLPENSRYRHDPVVRVVEPTSAVVDDCSIDDAEVVQGATGEVVNADVVVRRVVGFLVLTQGRWLVSAIDIQKGTTECSSAPGP